MYTLCMCNHDDMYLYDVIRDAHVHVHVCTCIVQGSRQCIYTRAVVCI